MYLMFWITFSTADSYPLIFIIKLLELYVYISEILIRTTVIRYYYITILYPWVL